MTYNELRRRLVGKARRSSGGFEQGRKRDGRDRHIGRFGAVVSHAQPRAMAGAARLEPRLAVRRVRDLCAVPDRRVRAASAARIRAIFAQIPRYAGYVLATTVFGWATGGVIGGIIADYIGRKRTMMLAILAYSLTTGLSAIAWNWESFAVLRFLVGVGIGSEWVTGASIVSELWPDHARGKGGGLLQRRRDRQLPRLGRLAVDRRAGAQRLALHVSGRRAAGAARVVDLAQHAGIGALGRSERAPARGAGACGAAAPRWPANMPR